MKIQAISGFTRIKITHLPVPPLSAYQAYIDSRNRTHGNIKMDGRKLRRAVIMIRQGESFKDIGCAIGFDSSTVRGWIEFLPLDLQP